ncbi:hypothetical protein EXIGLDRAFT_342202 [Exidia glandulosa HHB12029]|uniref:Secreted protein n=1 Tax=Exidia glandulosa HHB12029 TaxID=1314781 RepID=A0A165LGZ1_EXIGL|nr:hypothetical protein EXIGLDRAFT_342202 [Exidia glandulosa HHB12029]
MAPSSSSPYPLCLLAVAVTVSHATGSVPAPPPTTVPLASRRADAPLFLHSLFSNLMQGTQQRKPVSLQLLQTLASISAYASMTTCSAQTRQVIAPDMLLGFSPSLWQRVFLLVRLVWRLIGRKRSA